MGDAAAGAAGVMVEPVRVGAFTELTGANSRDWVGDQAVIVEKKKSRKGRPARLAVRAFENIDGVTIAPPGVTLDGSAGVEDFDIFGSVIFDAGLEIIAGNFNTPVTSFGSADFNGDGAVDTSDLALLLGSFNTSGSGNGNPAASTDARLLPFERRIDDSESGIPWRVDMDFARTVSQVRTVTSSRAKFAGEKVKSSRDTGWIERDSIDAPGQQKLHRFNEAMFDKKGAATKRLVNASAVAENRWFSGRLSSSGMTHKKADSRATSLSMSRTAITHVFASTQIADFTGTVKVQGDASLDLALVDLATGESVLKWSTDGLDSDGEYEFRLITAVEGGLGETLPNADPNYLHPGYELRFDASTTAKVKGKRKNKSTTSALEYDLNYNFTRPESYQAPQWTYTATRWTDRDGDVQVAGSEIPSLTGKPGADGYVLEASYYLDAPTVHEQLPFDPQTVGTDDYFGAMVLSDELRPLLVDELGSATLTPRYTTGTNTPYVLSFGPVATADTASSALDVEPLAEALIAELRDLGMDASLFDDWRRWDGAFDARQGLLLIPASALEIAGLWAPLVTEVTLGGWAQTREEVHVDPDVALADYLAKLEAEGVTTTPIFGSGVSAASFAPTGLSVSTAAVPEPGVAAVLGLGLGVGLLRRRSSESG